MDATLRDGAGSVELLVRTSRGDAPLAFGEHPESAAARLGAPGRITDIVCTPAPAWKLVFATGDPPRARGPDEALAPARNDGFEGAPGPFGHITDRATGKTLRMQVFLLVRRATDGRVAFVPHDGTFYLPATNLSRGEDPWHAARRIARDWFVAALPLPRLRQVQNYPPDPDWFVETVYESILPPGHPVASLTTLTWRAIGEAPPEPMFVDQGSIWRATRP